MIGNPKWFNRRKYTGWGLTPQSWQGWLYILGILSSFGIVHLLSVYFNLTIKIESGMMFVLSILFMIDVVDIMRKINNDERELLHEAIAERNVTWYITLVLSIGILYQIFYSIAYEIIVIDPFLIIALIGGTIIKGLSNWYLIDK